MQRHFQPARIQKQSSCLHGQMGMFWKSCHDQTTRPQRGTSFNTKTPILCTKLDVTSTCFSFLVSVQSQVAGSSQRYLAHQSATFIGGAKNSWFVREEQVLLGATILHLPFSKNEPVLWSANKKVSLQRTSSCVHEMGI